MVTLYPQAIPGVLYTYAFQCLAIRRRSVDPCAWAYSVGIQRWYVAHVQAMIHSL